MNHRYIYTYTYNIYGVCNSVNPSYFTIILLYRVKMMIFFFFSETVFKFTRFLLLYGVRVTRFYKSYDTISNLLAYCHI